MTPEPAASVTLREVTADTVRAVCNLKAEPEGFVAPNAATPATRAAATAMRRWRW
jgi:hypothetical protein